MDTARERLWADLMRAGLAGDGGAYRRFLSDVTPLIRSEVARSAARWSDVGIDPEDVVQEVLIAVHLKRHTWDEGRPVVPWLRAIARYKAVDAVRCSGRRREVDIDAFAEIIAAPEPERAPIFSLERYLDVLPRRQRQVVEALTVDGVSVRETASRLRMTENAVRVTLHRGLKMLVKTFGGVAS